MRNWPRPQPGALRGEPDRPGRPAREFPRRAQQLVVRADRLSGDLQPGRTFQAVYGGSGSKVAGSGTVGSASPCPHSLGPGPACGQADAGTGHGPGGLAPTSPSAGSVVGGRSSQIGAAVPENTFAQVTSRPPDLARPSGPLSAPTTMALPGLPRCQRLRPRHFAGVHRVRQDRSGNISAAASYGVVDDPQPGRRRRGARSPARQRPAFPAASTPRWVPATGTRL